MKKKAMELAINFIVMLILGMAIFGVGIYFATNIFGKTATIGSDLDQQTTTMLENKLRDSSLPVAFGKFKQTVKKGGNVKFALGIANNEVTEKMFTITVECSKKVKNSQEVGDLECPTPPNPKDIIVPAKDYKTSAILFVVDKKISAATYIYDVIVTDKDAGYPDEAYGGLQKLYIEVK